ncbi:protein EOLA1-like [Corticium candelabrum]|uniref:protein EOLA1-like n=1 Tax=Corticium candelabrum TaxID=121492 RepID=UPI002E25CC34|nr:protein EOLA1-like [Corticium candelabrum]
MPARRLKLDMATATKTLPCVSYRQPYAALVLNGVKTIESRWSPIYSEVCEKTVAVYVTWKEWEGVEWRDVLKERGMSNEEITEVSALAYGMMRGQVVGVVDVGITWKCSDESAAKQMQQLEHAAVLRPLTDKYLTELSNPRWLTCPLEIARGQKGVFEVQVPLHALPK